ncbi:MAG TPA: MFS transporter, partial [Planctomycetaceae bacterium]
MSKYLTVPPPTDRMPRGVPYIVGNEAAERFSYYGMRAILYVFMTEYLTTAAGEDAFMTEAEATEWQGWFMAAAYFCPLLGAIVADVFLGKYRTILYLSLLYCAGHATLALTLNPDLLGGIIEPKYGLAAGLAMIALGTGAIKPCVSSHVGDQFGPRNARLLAKVYNWFYFSINFGSFFSTLLTPWLLAKYGPDVAFGVPGVLMAVATFVFWLGRRKFVHVPPRGTAAVKEVFSPEGLRA